ncbi:MAG TPA: glycosyltransferase family 2 protein [Acidimicrobiales bacterium]|nr:glycosyltransferase family 2 protein [Acidimicrobiales bacterium]
MTVIVAIPCHEDEPVVDATVRSVMADAPGTRVVVCINGRDPANSVAQRALRGLAIDVIHLDVASKPAAWTRLRQEDAAIIVFIDADVTLEGGSIAALVDALSDEQAVIAAAGQRHDPPTSLAERVASVPHRLEWGGLLGTLYAARTAALPAEMPGEILLDDAWLWAVVGPDRIVRVEEAIAVVRRASTFRDLWRQRVRAEAGKRQLTAIGLPLAPPAQDASIGGAIRAYPAREWPLVALLTGVKIAARLRARVGPPRWLPAVSSKTRP